jgi:sugar lactone lactonase YvrE
MRNRDLSMATAGGIAALTVLAICAATAMAGQQAAAPGPVFKVVGKWGGTGTGPGKFGGGAMGIVVDKAGTVYVADTNANRFQSFSSKGAFKKLFTVATGGTTPDVAISPDGEVWGTTQVNAQVLRYPKAGGAPETFATPKSADGVAVDADGNVYVSTSGDAIAGVVRFAKTATGWEPAKMWATGFQWPVDVEASPDGTFYVADVKGAPPNVKRFDANGRLLKRINMKMPATAGAGVTLGIGVDLDCNLWTVNQGQRNVMLYSPAGKLLATATSGDMLATDIAVGPTGDLYLFDIYGPNSVVHFAEDRSKPQVATVAGVTVAKKGARYVASVKYSLAGVACPAEVPATATLTGKGIAGKATGLKLAAGKTTTIEIPLAKAASGPATFTIVLKTNGRPTTQSRELSLKVP